MELIEHELTDQLLNAAVAVHRELGPEFLESKLARVLDFSEPRLAIRRVVLSS